MFAKNSRISITLEESTAGFLAYLADLERKSISSLVNELISEALEHREDIMLSAIAEIRDKINEKKVKHDNTWK